MPPNMHPQYQHPQNHPGMPHSMVSVSAGPPLQFYPGPIPITSSANGHNSHMRATNTQFFPINHGQHMMGNQGHHQHPSNNGPQLAVVTQAGHPMNVGNMGMSHIQPMPPVSHHSHPHPGVGSHLVMSNPGGPPQGQNGLMSNPNQQMMMAPNGMPLMSNNRGGPTAQQVHNNWVR